LTEAGAPWQFTEGGYYHDVFVRTAQGWRIESRVEETSWWDRPMPGLPARPEPLPVDVGWLTGGPGPS
jgi:hypothetical protein